MKPAIKAEFRKLLTIRSTYIVSVIFLVICALASYFVEGGVPAEGMDANRYRSAILSGTSTIALAGAIVCSLLMAHEYRYNTIVYTLVAANKRIKVIIAKVIAGLTYSLAIGVLCAGVIIASMHVAYSVHHVTLPPQSFDMLEVFGKYLFYIGVYSLFGLLYAVAFRNIVVPFVLIFLMPGIVEGLLGLVLKENAKYLPFSALNSVIGAPQSFSGNSMTPLMGGLIALLYFSVAWVVATWIFYRRDAN